VFALADEAMLGGSGAFGEVPLSWEQPVSAMAKMAARIDNLRLTFMTTLLT